MHPGSRDGVAVMTDWSSQMRVCVGGAVGVSGSMSAETVAVHGGLSTNVAMGVVR